MSRNEVNDGRGFPLADEEEAPAVVAPHRVLLLKLIQGALTSEFGVRNRRAKRVGTDYYAGRRRGYVASAARLMEVLYGGKYEIAKYLLGTAIVQAGDVAEADTLNDLVEADTSAVLAETIAKAVLARI